MAKNIYSWMPEDYMTTETVRKSHSKKEIAAEYSRLRDIAHKRLTRLGESEFKSGDVYRGYKDAFPYVKNIPAGQLPSKLVELRYFLDLKTGTVSGAKRVRSQIIKTMHARGFKFINAQNLEEFGRFMEFAKDLKLAAMYDSDRIAALYDWTREQNIRAEEVEKDFNFWLKYQHKLEGLEDPPKEWTSKKKLSNIRRKLFKQYKKEARTSNGKDQR